MVRLLLFLVFIMTFIGCKNQEINKIEMHLSAYGVESDNFPDIKGFIDFEKGTSLCKISYYNPIYRPSEYSFSEEEKVRILDILEGINLDLLKENYSVRKTDQATSILIIYAKKKVYRIEDYGLEGDAPLPEIYKLIYKPGNPEKQD